MSANFANNYFFTLNRNLFGGFGYKMISYEGLNQINGVLYNNLTEFSDEIYLVKNVNTESGFSIFELNVILKYLTYKYYLSYYVFYLKAFYEFEPFNFRTVQSNSLFLSI